MHSETVPAPVTDETDPHAARLLEVALDQGIVTQFQVNGGPIEPSEGAAHRRKLRPDGRAHSPGTDRDLEILDPDATPPPTETVSYRDVPEACEFVAKLAARNQERRAAQRGTLGRRALGLQR